MRNRSLDGRVCESFFANNLSSALNAVERIKSLGELRFDLSNLHIDDIKTIKEKTEHKLIFTCRGGNISKEAHIKAYRTAIESNYDYIDIDLQHDGTLLPSLRSDLSQSSCQLMLSYHNYEKTPSLTELKEIIKKLASSHADLVKVATLTHRSEDVEKLILAQKSHQNTICLGMGEFATQSRIQSVLNDGDFTFVAFDLSKSTAKGQLDYNGFQNAYMNYRGGHSIKLAVLGNPIAHSKSPDLFKGFFTENERNGVYEKIELDNITEFESLKTQYDGFNVTAPFKQSIIPLLHELSDAAKQIGAVNTIYKRNDKWFGDNTDFLGILNAIKEGVDFTDIKNCLIIGAGGAARAAVYAMKSIGISSSIINRTHANAEKLAQEFSISSPKIIDIKNYQLIINTTPNPLTLINPDILQTNHIILDAIYPNSMFIPYQKEKRFTFIPGERWLYHQAKSAYDIFLKQ